MKTRTVKKARRKSGARPGVLIRSGEVTRSIGRAFWKRLKEAWNWCESKRQVRIANKSLRVEENVSLGMKRFVAVVKVGDRRFLLGGGGNDVALLASLPPEQSFRDELHESTKFVAPSVMPPQEARTSRSRNTGAGKCA